MKVLGLRVLVVFSRASSLLCKPCATALAGVLPHALCVFCVCVTLAGGSAVVSQWSGGQTVGKIISPWKCVLWFTAVYHRHPFFFVFVLPLLCFSLQQHGTNENFIMTSFLSPIDPNVAFHKKNKRLEPFSSRYFSSNYSYDMTSCKINGSKFFRNICLLAPFKNKTK